MDSKLINKNYGSIPHLSISKKNQQADKKITLNQESFLTFKTRDVHDKIIVLEKLDGANVGIVKINKEIYGVMRKGYDVRTSPFQFIQNFQEYVDKHRKRYTEMLGENERICGEWMVKVHSLEYHLPHEPFVAFDFITADNKRVIYDELKEVCDKYEVTTAGLVHKYSPISIEKAMEKMGNHGFHGCLETPEGIVYRCERKGKVDFLAKYVRDKVDGVHMNDESKYNRYLKL